MKVSFLFAGIALLLCLSFAEFNLQPYLYSSESLSLLNYTTFPVANGTAKLVRVSGSETFLLLNDKLVTDRGQIDSMLTEYYTRNFYPSSDELAEVQKYALLFNKSRNYMTRFGPAEKTCMEGGTFLAYKPCNDLTSCLQTASLVCAITGSEGCIVDLLATHILAYEKGVEKLNSAWAKFDSAYKGIGPDTVSSSLTSMDDAFTLMKTGADELSQSKLRFPEGGYTACRDCIGVCPDSHFDYAALTNGKQKIAALKEKTVYFSTLEVVVDKIAIATQERQTYRAGEETALLYKPKFDAAKSSFGGLKAQALEAKALSSDADFVAAANAFLDKETELDKKMSTRDFSGFDALLSSYQSSGKALFLVVNNSTGAYFKASFAQDSAGDEIIKAQWRVNRLSKASIDSYNTLADRKNKLDAQFKPPLSAAQYEALASSYSNLSIDARAFIAASTSFQDSVFGVGSNLGRASVDGVMGLAASMTPVSFKTRQSVAKYVPVLVVGVIDLAMLSVGIILFVGAFYYFHGFFRSKLAVSGWALTLLGFIFVLLIGSVGVYSIIANSDHFVSFSEYMGAVQSSGRGVVLVEETGVPATAVTAMRACAGQIDAQLKALGKPALKYYINGNICTSIVPKAANSSMNLTYETNSSRTAADCMNSIPDVPVFDLQYANDNSPPVFTTVVTKSAIVKGNEAYYGKVPMCDIANVLG